MKLTEKQQNILLTVLTEFDFESVANYMKSVNWTWYIDNNNVVPKTVDIKRRLKRLITTAFDYNNELRQNGENPTEVIYYACGGFYVYVWPNDFCIVNFSIADFVDDFNSENEDVE